MDLKEQSPADLTGKEPKQRDRKQFLEDYFCNAVDLVADCNLDVTANPEPLKPLLRYCDGAHINGTHYFSNFLFRGTLSLIVGQKGCRKSTLSRALVQILVNGQLPGKTPYTITPIEDKLKVAVIDTEQHPARVKRHFVSWLYDHAANKDDFKARCRYFTARGKSTDELLDLLYTICEVERPDVIVLDVISHFIDDINDQKNAKILVDILNEIMKRYGVAIVGVMHQNPSTTATAADKPAGAIGTKLLQAAEVVLHVARAAKNTMDYTTLGEIPGKAEERKAAKGNGTARNLGGDLSLVTFQEYRERYPGRPRFGIVNDNSQGENELFLLPIEAYHKNPGKGDDGEPSADLRFYPSNAVENEYMSLTNPEFYLQHDNK